MADADGSGSGSGSDDSSPSPSHMVRSSPLLAPPAAGRRPPPPCWTDEETYALLDAYREKWAVSRKKNLSASDWEIVAGTVTARCSRLPTATPKTGAQCRHKLEKLRKRYRGERQRRLSRGAVSPWPFYSVLEELSGDPPIPAAPNPPTTIRITSSSNNNHFNSAGSNHNNNAACGAALDANHCLPPSRSPPSSSSSEDAAAHRRSLSLNHLLSNGNTARPIVGSSSNANASHNNGFPCAIPKGSRSVKPMFKPATRAREADMADAFGELASALHAFTDGFLRVEQRKMDMARELERERMEAELRRTELMLESQRLVVDSILKRFLGQGEKRARVSAQEK